MVCSKYVFKIEPHGLFHGGLWASITGSMGSIPGLVTKIPQAIWCCQKKKKKPEPHDILKDWTRYRV